MKRSKFWKTMVDIMDAQFPKGNCKERGRAIVMLSYIEMMLNGQKFDENGEPTAKCKYCWDKGFSSQITEGFGGLQEHTKFCVCAKGKKLEKEAWKMK